MRIIKNSSRRREGGFIGRAGCFGLAITLGLLWGGGQGIYTGLKNRQPLEITCKEYLEKKPSVEWVTLTEARLDMMNSAYTTSRFGDKKPKELFIALRGDNERIDAPIQLLLASKDQALIDSMGEIDKKLQAQSGLGSLTPEILEALNPRRSVSGLIRFGIDADSKTRDKLAKLDLPLASDFLILDEGKTPDLWQGVGMLAAGLVVGFFLLRGGSSSSGTSVPPPLPPTMPPPLPPRQA